MGKIKLKIAEAEEDEQLNMEKRLQNLKKSSKDTLQKAIVEIEDVLKKELQAKMDARLRSAKDELQKDDELIAARERISITQKSLDAADDTLASAKEILEGLTGEGLPVPSRRKRSESPIERKVSAKRSSSPESDDE